MKATVWEAKSAFGVELFAETLEEAAVLVRLGMNAKKEVAYRSAHVSQGGEFSFSVSFMKRFKASNSIPPNI